MHIGFIGLGHMGGPMAANLLKAGHQLSVFDLSAAAVEALVGAGATACDSVAALATARPELVISMLPAAPHVKSLYLGDAGLLSLLQQPTHLLDCSTIDPHSAREVSAAARQAGHYMLDAPVSGGTAGATAGTLTFMVGGSAEEFEFARPVLAAMGKNIVHCGDSGNGQVAKVANNMLLGISMIGVAEAMALGTSLGIDAKVLAGIINTSSGRCWSSEVNNPYPDVLENVPASRGYTGGFGTDLMLKDLGLATEAARLAKQPVILGAAAQQLYQAFSLQGHGQLDFSAIIKLYTKQE
ncbi:3-hydroxyisobutyrate dehydrogenase [Thiopseudomonas denitrificans]|uniref:3-hydroxyisobutyrate dehydrogenase n=1 Tax=Thiopseudomonas denitrificans TaxID=1501432 RepID=A0A4R6U0H5_9GAMM|nr:3-hydroxyisobutyrate dehydrogenase [Thiopseudomonas denitrificans]TDQ37869.1 3-hydroxyisobutyrate dehydrogenase [Thiopseudomonas denitrificans]